MTWRSMALPTVIQANGGIPDMILRMKYPKQKMNQANLHPTIIQTDKVMQKSKYYAKNHKKTYQTII